MISIVEEDGSIKSFKNYYTEYTDYYLKNTHLIMNTKWIEKHMALN